MRKNVASQKIFFGLVVATTGAALVGATPTGVVTIDAGAQAGCTGAFSGLGNGQYSYSPSQAETNGNALGFTFTAATAVPVSMTIYTTAADPSNAASLGLTNLDAAVSTRATQANILSDATPFAGANIALIQAKTTNLPASPAAVGSNMGTVTGVSGNVTGDVQGKVLGGGASAMSAAGVRAVDAAGAALAVDSTVAKDATVAKEATLTTKIPTALSFTGANVNAESKVTAAPADMALNSTVAKDATVMKTASYTAPDNADIVLIKAKTDNLPASPASEGNVTAVGAAVLTRAAPGDAMTLTAPAVAALWNEVLEGTLTAREFMRIIMAFAAGKSTDDGQEFYDIAGVKKRIDGTVVGSDRTAVVLDGT